MRRKNEYRNHPQFFRILISVILLFSFSVNSSAEESLPIKNVIIWTDECRVDGHIIQFQAVSKSGEAAEDDADVFIIQDGIKTKIPHKPSWFHLSEAISDKKNCASKLPVFEIADNKILIILTVDGRPTFNWASFVLYNYRNKKVLGVEESVAQFKGESKYTNYVLLSHGKSAYKIRLVKESVGITDGPEDYIEAWMLIEAEGGNIKYKWLN